MPQGLLKKATRPDLGKANSNKRTAAVAKKKSKTSVDRLAKKITAGMAARTEKLLGERVGHLELLGKSKKGKKKDDTPKQKGGSKKFG